MLSKKDIEKEIGENICIFPLNEDNIKNNSINLTVSEYAWSKTNATVYYDETSDTFYDKPSNNKMIKCDLKNGKNTIFNLGNKKYVVLAPNSTTLIETEEVVSVSSKIGGTVHSKVGIVSLGTGHIGTMLGPKFSGHLLIAVHNVTDEYIKIAVGETFISLIFYYLVTPCSDVNANESGHLDKMASLKVNISQTEQREIAQDWKKNFFDVQRKLKSSDEYKNLVLRLKAEKESVFKKYINRKNIITLSVTGLAFLVALGICWYLDNKNNSSDAINGFFTVGFSGVLIAICSGVKESICKNKNE